MKIKHYAAIGLLCCAGFMQARQIDPITQAVLRSYEEILTQNPKDYETLYQRAVKYYDLNMYDQALNDVAKALQLTPAKDATLIANEFSLLADIQIELKNYDRALEAVNKELEITPDSYPAIYKKGNIYLYLGSADAAYDCFSSMQRLKSRSQEAYFGMAKALVMKGDHNGARELIKQAEQADPSNYITYCRVGDLYKDMGENENAATSYLSAFALTDSSLRPLESMIALASADYASFERAMDYALSKSSNRIPLYFLKGNIALNSGNFQLAYDAFSRLLDAEGGKEASVYANMAKTCLALDRNDEALANINAAIMKHPSADNYVIKSEIELASGNTASALVSADKALSLDASLVDALVLSAQANYNIGNREKAFERLNEAVLNDGTDLYPLMLRAYYYGQDKNTSKQSVADYMRASQMEAEDFPSIAYKALAQSKSGRIIDADTTVENGLKKHNDKNDLYYAAVYYAQVGNMQKAKELIDAAVAKGYGDMYKLNKSEVANLTISPIRYLMK